MKRDYKYARLQNNLELITVKDISVSGRPENAIRKLYKIIKIQYRNSYPIYKRR